MPSVALIQAVPKFVSEQEYQSLIASTPSSFNDLPPVVKRQEENVSVVLDPPVDGFSAEDAAKGTLLVLTRYVSYLLLQKKGLTPLQCVGFPLRNREGFPSRIPVYHSTRGLSKRRQSLNLLPTGRGDHYTE